MINNYPKSSCNCYKCNEKNYKYPKTGAPTNMSVLGCDFPKYYDCYDTKTFKSGIEPTDVDGFVYLNPKAVENLYHSKEGFYEIDCKNDSDKACSEKQYISQDPRAISSFHDGQQLTFGAPYLDATMKLKDIYTDPKMKDYGKTTYSSYLDVNAGDILYYVDKSISDAFSTPVYANPAYSKGYILVDPMGGIRPQYDRCPVKNPNLLQTKKDNFDYKLSWLQDSNEFREDLIARQQRTNNEQIYSTRYFSNSDFEKVYY